ncbi:MAG: exo-alpha-sialidase [Clostridia bacterium]|nr:exo-alpha-sialidase [Clostridia bacterium]
MKKLFLFAALIALLVSCGGNVTPAVTDPAADTTSADQITEEPIVDMKTAYIHKISELNTESERDSRGSEYASAGLASNFREYFTLEPSFLKTEVAFYPRVKQISDGTFILFYQNGNHGPDIYYCLSADGFNYETPQVLFKGTTDKLYSTCDALVLKNGDILAIASYRLASNYLRYPMQSGIVIKRSTDNGKTWSNEQVIFRGCNWEPSLLQLESGEIQAYWTNTTGLSTGEGTFTSTGTAIVRSYDNGYTWTGNINKAMQGQIVSQSKTEVIKGVQMFSDQMPVAVELHNGRIALALETRLDRVGSFRITISHSDDNWATELEAFKDVGPKSKLSNYCIGAGPYIGQFESGETVISYNRQNYLTFRLGDDNAANFGDEYAPYRGTSTNYWGCFDIIGTHSLVTANEYRTKNGSNERNYIVSGRLYLNHLIEAKRMSVTVDGYSDEWDNNTDALFVGSVSQAQCSTRFAIDGDNLVILCERLDYSRDADGDIVTVMITTDASSKEHSLIAFGEAGIKSATKQVNGKSESLDTSLISCATVVVEAKNEKDEGAGYVAEIKLPLSMLGSFGDGFICNVMLQNTDNGEMSPRDMLTGAKISDYSTWYNVKFQR